MIKYNTFADTGDIAHKRDGAPGDTVANSLYVEEGYALTSDDIAKGFQLASEAEFATINQASIAAYESWQNTSGPYVISDFFDRLTPTERSTIRGLTESSPEIADMWDKLMTLREGIECPPDGKTQGRAMAQAAYGACVQILGQTRADELFSR